MLKLAKRKGLKQSNFFTWTGICQAIQSRLKGLKGLEFNANKLNSLEFLSGGNVLIS